MTTLELYLYTTLIPNIGTFFSITAVVTGIGVVLSGISGMVLRTDRASDSAIHLANQILTLFIAICFVSASVATVLPNKEDLRTIIAGQYITNIQDIEKLPPNAIKLLNQYLEQATVQKKD